MGAFVEMVESDVQGPSNYWKLPEESSTTNEETNTAVETAGGADRSAGNDLAACSKAAARGDSIASCDSPTQQSQPRYAADLMGISCGPMPPTDEQADLLEQRTFERLLLCGVFRMHPLQRSTSLQLQRRRKW